MSWLPASPLIRGIVLGAVALVIVAGLGGAGWAWYSAQETRAREAYVEVNELVRQSQAPAATADQRARAVTALENILATHGRSGVVPQAGFQLGNLRYAEGQYAKARGAYQVALAGGASGSLKALCALGIAYTWEAEKDYAKALTAYEAALAGRGASDFLYEEILADLGRVQELGGQRQAAIDTYQRILKDVPDSRRADDIRSRLASLRSTPAK